MKLLPKAGLPADHPYLNNKYTQWYYDIVVHAINRGVINGYSEKHHIIPRSIGGRDDTNNLVRLTAREHYIVHMLLVRMTEKLHYHKMINAAWYLSHTTKDSNLKINARLFESLKVEIIRIQRERQTGRKLSDETRAKQSLAHKGKVKSPEHLAKLAASQTGKKLSAEAIAKRTATRRARGNYAHTEEHKNKLRGRKQSPELIAKRIAPLIGRKMSAESNEKRRLAMTGKKKSPEAVAKSIATRRANGNHRRTPESIAKGLATKAAKKLLDV